MRGLTTAPASAQLSLTMDTTYTTNGGTMSVKVYGVDDTSWTETGLTWNNAPGLDRTNLIGTGTLITTQTVTLTPGGTITFDISSYVASHLGQVITLQVISEAVSSGLIVLNSREVQVSKPSLALNFSNLSVGSSMGGTTTYTYDAAGRRTTLTSPSFSIGYTYDNADQLLTSTKSGLVTTYSYDANGSRTVLQSSNGTRTTYTWDVANRLQSVVLPSGNITTSTYRYDDLRFASSSPSGVQTFVWAQNNVLAAQGTSSTGSWTELFTHSDRLLRAVGNTSTNQTLNRQYHLDAIGTVEAITNSTQATEADYITDTWGNVLSGSAQDNPHVYLGGLGYWQEPNVELNYVRARWLDPQTGTWLSVDPIPTEPRYRYVNNMPTTNVDPSGKQSSRSPKKVPKENPRRAQREFESENPKMQGPGAIIFSIFTGIREPREKDFEVFSGTFVNELDKSKEAITSNIDRIVHKATENLARRMLKSIHHNKHFQSMAIKLNPILNSNSTHFKKIQSLAKKYHVAFLLPTSNNLDSRLDWIAGYIYGVADSAISLAVLLPLETALQILDICELVATIDNIWESIFKAAQEYLQQIDQANNRDSFTRGKTLGRLLVDVVMFFFTIKNAGKSVGKAHKSISERGVGGAVQHELKKGFGLQVTPDEARILQKIESTLKKRPISEDNAKSNTKTQFAKDMEKSGANRRKTKTPGSDTIGNIVLELDQDVHNKTTAAEVVAQLPNESNSKGIRDDIFKKANIKEPAGTAKNPIVVDKGSTINQLIEKLKKRSLVHTSRNGAIFVTKDGKVYFVTSGGEQGLHSEQYFFKEYIDKRKVEKKDVTHVFSQETPCVGPTSPNCLDKVLDLNNAKFYSVRENFK